MHQQWSETASGRYEISLTRVGEHSTRRRANSAREPTNNSHASPTNNGPRAPLAPAPRRPQTELFIAPATPRPAGDRKYPHVFLLPTEDRVKPLATSLGGRGHCKLAARSTRRGRSTFCIRPLTVLLIAS